MSWFFKTGPGEYGEGDKFLGLVSQQIKDIARQHLDLGFADLQKLLVSPIHEERVLVLRILVAQYVKAKKIGDKKTQKQVFDFYLKNIPGARLVTGGINNWDLVDLSAPNIVGGYIFNFYNKKEVTSFLLKLAKSKNLWARRVAVLATFIFIKNDQFVPSLELTEFLLIKPFDSVQGKQKEKEDLMHKAIGWMLREVGKKDKKVLVNFLKKFGAQLPRTTLRYAIERFPEAERQRFLKLTKPL